MGGALAIYAYVQFCYNPLSTLTFNFSGLTFDKPLGAIVGLSSFLLQREKIPGVIFLFNCFLCCY